MRKDQGLGPGFRVCAVLGMDGSERNKDSQQPLGPSAPSVIVPPCLWGCIGKIPYCLVLEEKLS